MITKCEVKLLLESWKLIEPIQNLTVGIFYSKLIPKAPEISSLVPKNILLQKEILLESVKTLLAGLDHLEYIALTYGQILIEFFRGKEPMKCMEILASVWISTLKIVLGKKFTIAMEDAWYYLFFDIMNLIQNNQPHEPIIMMVKQTLQV